MNTKLLNRLTDLSAKFAIVTGGGSGIGRAISITLAQAGATVAIWDLVAQRAQETLELVEQSGGSGVAAAVNITREDIVENLVADLVVKWGRIDILCNNAGIVDFMVPPAETSTEHWNRVIAVTLTGQFFVTRPVLRQMIVQRSGSIINTGSEAGLRGAASGIAYTSAKHGMVGFTRSIAWYHAADGIRCNSICPGPTDTNIAAGLDLSSFHPEGVKRLMPVIATSGQPADPQYCANLALFLASDAATHLNGVSIPVDGGWLAG